MTTPGGGQGSYSSSVQPPGGMGVTSQGYGQEGYVLQDEQSLVQPPDEALNFAVGVPYFLPFATPYRDSWEVFRDDPVSIRQLVTMRRRDGQARALYRLLTKPLLSAMKNADVVPADGVTGGVEEAQFCKDLLFAPKAMGGMTHSFDKFVKQMLLALFNGFSAWECVYWQPKTGPNKGKWTLRKIDWRPSETLTFLLDGQGEFNGFRQRCVTKDVEVLQLDGTSVRIDEMVRRHQAGEEQWVYSCTEVGKVVPGRVADARKTSDSEPLVEVELDNGEKVKCTLTHPWMLRDGTYKRAANLKPGDSLMPLYRSYVRPSSTSKLRYEKVLHPGTGRVEWTHSMVSRNLGFAAGRGYVIHHDFCGLRYLNNDPRNLRRMTQAGHRSLHNEASQNGGIKAAHAAWEELGHEERSRLSSERARKRWQNPDYRAGGSARLEASRVATDPARWGHHSSVTFADIERAAARLVSSGGRLTKQAVWQKLGCSQDVIDSRVAAAGFESWKQFKQELVRRYEEWLRKKEARRDAAVLKVLVDGLDDLDWGAIFATLEEDVPVNHKVVAVRPAEPEAVYDIEVAEHHNFALKAGVFVHNTFFQGRTIDVKIAKETALYYAHEEAERPFYGVSMFESAFYHYDKKEKLYYIAHLAAQRAAVGLRVGTMVPNAPAEDKNNFVKALSQLGLAQYIALPTADWTVQTLNESASRFDFLGLINHHNSQMSKSVLAQWFDNEQGGGQGDSTLVDFGKQDDVTYFLMLEGILEEMAGIITDHIFPRFVDWNFGTGKYPQFKWGPLTEEAKAAIQDTFDKLATAGPQANVTPEFMLDLEQRMATDFGFDIDYDKIKSDREKQQKQMAAQQKAAAQQAQEAQQNPVQAGKGGSPQQPVVHIKVPVGSQTSATGTSASSGGSGVGANTKGNGLGG
jgi:Intein splicing domain